MHKPQTAINENINISMDQLNNEQLSSATTDRIMFTHFVDCLIDIANNQHNDIAIYHLKQALNTFTTNN